VDGQVVTELGTKADPAASRIEVDGTRIEAEPPVYLVFHKPRNVVSTMHDPEGRPTVAEYMKEVGARVVPIGRLDFHTSGTLLLTNDGEFSVGLLHPRKASPKVYVAKVAGEVSPEDVLKWQESILVDGRPTRPAEVKVLRYEGDKTWLEVVLREGKNRQIHRLGEATGFPVMRLARLSFAGITSEGLRPGEWRPLTESELTLLRREYGVPKKESTTRHPDPQGPRSDPKNPAARPSSDRNSLHRGREPRPALAARPPQRAPSRRR
jgi:23S rRNA pseudouridine2605 synthase